MPKPKKHGVQPTPAHSLTNAKAPTSHWGLEQPPSSPRPNPSSGWDEPANERKGHHKIKVCIYITGAKDCTHNNNSTKHKRKLLTTKAIPTNGFIYIMHTKPNA